MPLAFYSTSTFRQALTTLCKKERHGYHHCRTDICDKFENLTFNDIYEHARLVREYGDIRLIKIRLPISHLNVSAAAGFRLIVACSRADESVTLLNIYPKKGKLALSDLSLEVYKALIKSFIAQKRAGELIRHDIDNDLAHVP